MKIRLLSDIHHEFYEDKKLYQPLGEDVLVIAGDVHAGKERTLSALKEFGRHNETIIYVPGNHEYYGESIAEFNDYIMRFTRNTNIHFLNPGSFMHNGVAFIGACLWTNFRKDAIAKMQCARNVNDFRRIRDFDTDLCSLIHTEHFKYIKESYALYPHHKKVIVTHFLPAVECISEEFRGPDLLNNYFANDYGDLISYMHDTTWLFGHTHSNVDVVIGDTRCIANPYGYNYNDRYMECLIEI